MDVSDITYDASGGGVIAARIWRPESLCAGVVQIAHGMSEHMGRYDDFAGFLVSRGFAVCANDHMGHGGSYNGCYGYMGERDGHSHMLNDMRRLHTIAAAEFGPAPYIVLGHSMGSFLARGYCARFGDMISGAVFSGTGQPPPGLGLAALIIICRVMVKLKGGRARAGRLGLFAGRAGNAPGWLTADEALQNAFVADERCGFPFTYAGYLELLRLIKAVSGRRWYGAVSKTLPIYIFSGDRDPVGAYGKGPAAVYKRLVAYGCSDVTLRLYPGGRHEMLNETNRLDVYAHVAEWLERVAEK